MDASSHRLWKTGRFPTGVPGCGSPGDPKEVVKFARSCRPRSKGGASGAKAHFVFALTAGLKSRPSDLAIYEMASNHRSHITRFLIDTLAIRNDPKSLGCSADAHSNRHSSGASAGVPDLIRQRCQDEPKLPGERSAVSWNPDSSTSSPSSTSSTSSSPLRFASRTTQLEVPCLLPNLLCYSFPVTRVPPMGSARQRQRDPTVAGLECLRPAMLVRREPSPQIQLQRAQWSRPVSFCAIEAAERPSIPDSARRNPPLANTGVKEKPCASSRQPKTNDSTN